LIRTRKKTPQKPQKKRMVSQVMSPYALAASDRWSMD
jgi:hypothetical protein